MAEVHGKLFFTKLEIFFAINLDNELVLWRRRVVYLDLLKRVQVAERNYQRKLRALRATLGGDDMFVINLQLRKLGQLIKSHSDGDGFSAAQQGE